MDSKHAKPDRYVSFKGIDCEGNARKLMVMLRRHIDDPAKTNPFWEKFKVKIEAASTPADNGLHQDELFLIHSYINNLQELFEEYDDREALALLRRIELECC